MHIHPHLVHVHLYTYLSSIDSCCLCSLSCSFLRLCLCNLHEWLYYTCTSTSSPVYLAKSLMCLIKSRGWAARASQIPGLWRLSTTCFLLLHNFLHSRSLGCCGLASPLPFSESRQPSASFSTRLHHIEPRWPCRAVVPDLYLHR